MVKHADSQTGVVSLIPACVTLKTPLVRKATGNHLMNSTSLENTQSPVSGFCYAPNGVCFAVNFKKSISLEKTQSPVSGFCYAPNGVCFAVVICYRILHSLQRVWKRPFCTRKYVDELNPIRFKCSQLIISVNDHYQCRKKRQRKKK